jgi:hypothetical protein
LVEVAAGSRCLNCGALLAGTYCASCGQKHEPEIHTLRHFAAEAFESITHADSRLWRTLLTLIARPGELTREFFAGRRARYLPPVRFYLVVSVLFFFIASIASRDANNVVQIDVGPDDTAEAAADAKANSGGVCTNIEYTGPFKDWIGPLLPIQCRKILADDGRGFLQAAIQNLPKALFILLPLLAAFMKLLYWRPARHYVEHLLLLLHNHINLFLGYGVLVLLEMWLPDSGVINLLGVSLQFWLLWYIYRAMRVYYDQSRRRTLAKFAVMLLVYLTAAIVTMATTALISAMTL